MPTINKILTTALNVIIGIFEGFILFMSGIYYKCMPTLEFCILTLLFKIRRTNPIFISFYRFKCIIISDNTQTPTFIYRVYSQSLIYSITTLLCSSVRLSLRPRVEISFTIRNGLNKVQGTENPCQISMTNEHLLNNSLRK